MKRITNISRLELSLFFMLVIAVLMYIDLRQDIQPLKQKAIEYDERIKVINNLIHSIENREVYIDVVQDNMSKAEDTIKHLNGDS